MEFLIAFPFIVVVFVLLYLFFKTDVKETKPTPVEKPDLRGSSSFD